MSIGYLGQVQQQALRQTLSTQQIQYIKLLQMNSIELNAYLSEVHLENPLIDLEPPARTAEMALFTCSSISAAFVFVLIWWPPVRSMCHFD